jgi:lipopolysaccharide biosynthesis glycosyltransferase
MNTFPVFFSFDDNYVTQAAVTFESLLTNSKEGDFYDLYVVHEDITPENRVRLVSLVKSHRNACLSFIDSAKIFSGVEIAFTDDNFSTGGGKVVFTKETLFRCLPTLIPDFDRYDTILYSDVDICVVDDISELFGLDLSEHYLAGCRVPKFLEYQTEHLPERFAGRYFAGGLWLMNLNKMRQDNLVEKIIGIIKEPPFRLIWNDQDIMNLACDLKVTYFSYRYISIPIWDKILRKVNYFDEYYPDGELYEAMYRPKIIHYAHAKPWKERCAGVDLWYYWLNKTNFHKTFQRQEDEPVYSRRIKIYLFSLISIPRFLIEAKREGTRLIIRVCGFLLNIRVQLP